MPWVTGVADAAALLKRGELCALPTETVYGLAAMARDAEAVAGIYEVKGRPRFNPLIVHVDGLEQAARVVELSGHTAAERLAAAFWPGPLTLVLARREDAPVCELASAGLPTLAVRWPAHPLMRQVIAGVGEPLVAPSANRSGRLSPTRAAHVVDEFGEAVPVLDGGTCEAGLESTIIGFDGETAQLLRPGAVPVERIEEVLGGALASRGLGIVAPGMMTSHYAPQARLRLDAQKLEPGEVGLDFAAQLGADVDLSAKGDLREAAANLFTMLRRLDAAANAIAVAPIPSTGLGLAINDRLARAAAPRDR